MACSYKNMNHQLNQSSKISKNTWIIIVVIVITALIAGGSVYTWQGSVAKKSTDALQQQINDLQNQIQQLQQQNKITKELSVRNSVKQALLSEPPAGYGRIPEGTKLLNVKVEDGATGLKISLDFSKELISSGAGRIFEDAIHQITVKITNDNPWVKDAEYTILIEGKTVEEYRRDETAHWETYQHNDLGFEIRYPNDWIVIEEDEKGVALRDLKNNFLVIIGEDDETDIASFASVDEYLDHLEKQPQETV